MLMMRRSWPAGAARAADTAIWPPAGTNELPDTHSLAPACAASELLAEAKALPLKQNRRRENPKQL
jgi:hypothetical protein